MFLGVRPAVCKWASTQVQWNRGLSLNALAIMLIMVFVSAAVTDKIGIFSIFGGFTMGAIVFDQKEVRHAIRVRLQCAIAFPKQEACHCPASRCRIGTETGHYRNLEM